MEKYEIALTEEFRGVFQILVGQWGHWWGIFTQILIFTVNKIAYLIDDDFLNSDMEFEKLVNKKGLT